MKVRFVRASCALRARFVRESAAPGVRQRSGGLSARGAGRGRTGLTSLSSRRGSLSSRHGPPAPPRACAPARLHRRRRRRHAHRRGGSEGRARADGRGAGAFGGRASGLWTSCGSRLRAPRSANSSWPDGSSCPQARCLAPPPSGTKWTRRVPHPVLIGHAASLTPCSVRLARPACSIPQTSADPRTKRRLSRGAPAAAGEARGVPRAAPARWVTRAAGAGVGADPFWAPSTEDELEDSDLSDVANAQGAARKCMDLVSRWSRGPACVRPYVPASGRAGAALEGGSGAEAGGGAGAAAEGACGRRQDCGPRGEAAHALAAQVGARGRAARTRGVRGRTALRKHGGAFNERETRRATRLLRAALRLPAARRG